MTPTPIPQPVRTRFNRAEEETGDQRDRWLISYADLVTLLFSLFVLLYATADQDRAKAVASAITKQIGEAPGRKGVLPGGDTLTSTRRAVESVLAKNEVGRTGARVTKAERGFVVSLAEGGFFSPGEATLSKDAYEVLDTLAATLGPTSAVIRVEGHTDSTPISTARFPSNWELSSARASAVLARLLSQGVNPARLSVAGYASQRPVADNDTPEGRALNRRVDLVVLPPGK
ncbi:MAG TPA: OmpA family protein [Blastocatellia bacterium]|nr:OmpA family protein [Blastocatellia bacterium]